MLTPGEFLQVSPDEELDSQNSCKMTMCIVLKASELNQVSFCINKYQFIGTASISMIPLMSMLDILPCTQAIICWYTGQTKISLRLCIAQM